MFRDFYSLNIFTKEIKHIFTDGTFYNT